MRTTRIFLCFFKVFCFLWISKPTSGISNLLSAPDSVTGTYGGSVTVSCQYDLRYRDYTKYWCKGPVYEMCGIVVKTPKNRPSERSFISDNKEEGVFTVTMTSLAESDENMYWCVIARSGKNVYTGVRLLLSHAASTPISTTEINSLLIPGPQEIRWWTILRWIIFMLMLCCLALTHYAVRRINNAHEMQHARQIHQKSSTIRK